jgi:hypothetical protein
LFTGIQNHGHEHGVALPDQEEEENQRAREGRKEESGIMKREKEKEPYKTHEPLSKTQELA